MKSFQFHIGPEYLGQKTAAPRYATVPYEVKNNKIYVKPVAIDFYTLSLLFPQLADQIFAATENNARAMDLHEPDELENGHYDREAADDWMAAESERQLENY